MIFTVDAEIQRKGARFCHELYGAALCVHLPDGSVRSFAHI